MYYGTSLITNKPVEIDRTDLMLPHKAIFGIAGSGTNLLMKAEMIKVQEAYPNDTIIWVDFHNEFFSFGESLLDYSVFRVNEMLKWDTDLNKLIITPFDKFNVVTLFNVENSELKEAKKRTIQILLNTIEAFKENGRRFWIFLTVCVSFSQNRKPQSWYGNSGKKQGDLIAS